MDYERVDVVQLEVLQGLHDVRLNVLSAVVPIPELCLDEKVLPLDDPLGKQLLQGLANHVLVIVVVGAVNQPSASIMRYNMKQEKLKRPVSRLDSSDDRLLGLLGGRLPGAETKSGHLSAIIESDVEIVHLVLSCLTSLRSDCPVLTC